MSETASNTSPFLFEPGEILVTPGALNWVNQNLPLKLLFNNFWAILLINFHICGIGWDELSSNDRKLNLQAIKPGHPGRVMSVYRLSNQRIWIITEWHGTNNPKTTILLPNEY